MREHWKDLLQEYGTKTEQQLSNNRTGQSAFSQEFPLMMVVDVYQFKVKTTRGQKSFRLQFHKIGTNKPLSKSDFGEELCLPQLVRLLFVDQNEQSITAGTVDRLIYYGIYFVYSANKISQGAGSVRCTAVLNPAVGPEKQLLLNCGGTKPNY